MYNTQQAQPVLRISNLRKEYKSLTALDNLSFELEPGDIFGFIGPNGAGKTTTIRMVATLLVPTSGTAYVNGIDVTRYPDEVRSQLGYMPDFFGVYDDVKVWEYLDFFAAAYRIPKKQRGQVITDVLELTDLTVKRDAYVEELSRGDEAAPVPGENPGARSPAAPPRRAGLRPRSPRAHRAEGTAEGAARHGQNHPRLLTHPAGAADFCNKIGIIEKGKLLLFGGVEEILAQINGGRGVTVRLAEGEELSKARDVLNAIDGVSSLTDDGKELQVTFDHSRTAQHAILAAPSSPPACASNPARRRASTWKTCS